MAISRTKLSTWTWEDDMAMFDDEDLNHGELVESACYLE